MKTMATTEPKLAQAMLDCHKLLTTWIIPQLDRMPRVRRYTLGERLETLQLQVSEKPARSQLQQIRRNAPSAREFEARQGTVTG